MEHADDDGDLRWFGERRLVRRVPVPDVPVTLNYQRRGVFRARSGASLCAVLADISAIGAQIVGVASQHLVLRSLIDLDLAGDRAVALVRDIRMVDETNARYGVEFVEMSDRFRERILALADRADLERQRG